MNDFKGLIALAILAALVATFSAPWRGWFKKLATLPSSNHLPYRQNPIRILLARYRRREEFSRHTRSSLDGKMKRQDGKLA